MSVGLSNMLGIISPKDCKPPKYSDGGIIAPPQGPHPLSDGGIISPRKLPDFAKVCYLA